VNLMRINLFVRSSVEGEEAPHPLRCSDAPRARTKHFPGHSGRRAVEGVAGASRPWTTATSVEQRVLVHRCMRAAYDSANVVAQRQGRGVG
jgi:hypothetical protein